MKRALALNAIAAGCALCLAAGCSVIPPQPKDQTQYYVLTPMTDPATTPITQTAGMPANISIGLGPIHIPDYLDRSQIVTRSAGNAIKLSETDRWAEPLGAGFGQAMAQDLTAILGTHEIHY